MGRCRFGAADKARSGGDAWRRVDVSADSQPYVATVLTSATCAAARPIIPLAPLLVLAMAITACQGSEISTNAIIAGGGSVSLADGQLSDGVDAVGAAGSLCVADSDCAASASGPCAAAFCDAPSGRCLVGRRPDFSTCDDGEPCSAESFCVAGACLASRETACDDSNPCTRDECQAGSGCQATPKTLAACDDGNPCTVDDRCDAGACVAVVNLCGCSDDAGCANLQDLCHGGWACVQGTCAPLVGQDRDCGDGNPCTIDSCDPKVGCQHQPLGDGAPCADGSVCTAAERCLAGACVAAATLPCGVAPAGACVASLCDAKLGCQAADVDQGASCDDGDTCTGAETCRDGACVGVSTCGCRDDADCAVAGEDLLACAGAPVCRLGRCERDIAKAVPCAQPDAPCSVARCTAKGCEVTKLPGASACDDGDACSGGDACNGDGVCKGGTTVGCDDGIDCTQDACIPSVGCLAGPSSLTLPCDDGNACTSLDACDGLQCIGKPTTCDDDDPCTTDFCHPVLAACAHAALAEGADCVDDDACTLGSRCLTGLCVAAQVTTCDDGNPCTTDGCLDDGACDFAAVATATACDDGDACTAADACLGGACEGGANTCACKSAADCKGSEDADLCNGTLHCVANVCVVDPSTVVACPLAKDPCITIACAPATGLCLEAAATNFALCDDGDACSEGERCAAGGACVGGVPKACDDGDACTLDGCDSAKGCVALPLPSGAAIPCSDGNPCTFGDVCGLAGCTPGKNACQCQTDADCAASDDQDLCTPPLVCNAGSCKPASPPLVCDASLGSPCVDHLCLPTTGKCTLVTRADAAACKVGSGAGCLGAGVCQAGQCLTGAAIACDDGKVCTLDQCTTAGVCAHLPATGQPCDDGDACTEADACGPGGACDLGKDTCECKTDADCPDDADLCNGIPQCLFGKCAVIAGTVVSCSILGDGPCKATACVAASGECKATLQPDQAPCDDGTACTTATACNTGACVGGSDVACDDGNLCTSDGCNPAQGCFAIANTAPCDDGDPCSLGDVCQAGACTKGPGTCECLVAADCKDDGDKCNGTPSCKAGLCVTDPASVVTCDATGDGPCHAAVCSPASGACVKTAFPDGTACSDANPCTVQDQCTAGACGGKAFGCDDGNVCSTDACDPQTGCSNQPNAAGCDDGDPCTGQDSCAAGSCNGGPDVCGACKLDSDCPNDGKPCTAQQCDVAKGTCVVVNLPTGAACDDGDACTPQSACAVGLCKGQGALTCDDSKVCTGDGCDPIAGCVAAPLTGAPCEDGNACTVADACALGVCQGGPNTCECKIDADCAAKATDLCTGKLACSAGACVLVPGTAVVCAPSAATCASEQCQPATGVCASVAKPDGVGCDDGSACTLTDTCAAGICKGGPAPGCDDGNPCTSDACDSKLGCTQTANDGPCDDGDGCTQGEACLGGSCKGGVVTCECKADADCLPFDDGNLCNGVPVCKQNECQVSDATSTICPASVEPCKASVCIASTGKCGLVALANGLPCVDGDACTSGEICLSGVCSKQAVGCDDKNACTTDACAPDKGCTHAPVGGLQTCNDGDPCTPISVCQSGVCVGPINTCGCQTNADCKDDGDACNGKPTCQSGNCKVDAGTIVTCADNGKPCQPETCQPATGACQPAPAPVGTSCDDGNGCTIGDLCSVGACIGVPLGCDDGVDCTKDACATGLGCLHQPDAKLCDDANVCTKESCDPQAGCLSGVVSGTPCDDGDPCSEGELCSGGPEGGICGGGQPKACDDLNPCTIDACDPVLGCLQKGVATGAPCDDGAACTSDDACGAGGCQGKGASCDDGDPCTVDACDASAPGAPCVSTPQPGAACDDGDACTSQDVCSSVGACGGKPQVCDDGNACTTDVCKAGACTQTLAVGASCNDQQPCTDLDACNGAGLCVGVAKICDDGNACTADSCNNAVGGCVASVLPGYSNDFSIGTQGIALQSNNAQVSWQIDGKRAASPSKSLYIGNIQPLFGTYSYNFGLTVATATLPSVLVPKGVSKATLKLQVYFDSGEAGGCTGVSDRVAVALGAQVLGQVCGDTGGFVQLELDLTAQAGNAIAPVITFFANPFQNSGEGAWIDDVELGWTCTP